ncbi:hypothetical protein EDD15DRAFT_2200614 [Pisolithus albus]|nr:hypothetical protein EDD15DRAFT_2200614 [Pisolithus albus]
MPSDYNEAPHHYSGPPTSESALAGALEPPHPADDPAEENQFSNCPPQPCLYLRDGNPCNMSITCGLRLCVSGKIVDEAALSDTISYGTFVKSIWITIGKKKTDIEF